MIDRLLRRREHRCNKEPHAPKNGTPTLFESPKRCPTCGETDTFSTLRWVGDAATGYLEVDRPDPAADASMSRSIAATCRRSGRRSNRCGCGEHPPSASQRLMGRCSAHAPRAIRDGATVRRASHEATASLRTSRPTAVNLFWALDRMDRCLPPDDETTGAALLEMLLAEARKIDEEDRSMCRAIGRSRCSSGPAGSWRLDPLQRRRPGNRRLRNRPGRDLRRA